MSTPLLSIDTAHAAVLGMDLQTAIVSIYAKGDADLLTRAAAVLKEAREHRLSVIHVQVGFRPGLPEISLRNPLLSAIKNSVQHQQLFQGLPVRFIQQWSHNRKTFSLPNIGSVPLPGRTWI